MCIRDRLIDHGSRRAVELGRIVDDEHEPPLVPTALDDLDDRVHRQLGAPRVHLQLEEQRGQCGEGEPRGGRRGPDHDRRHPAIGAELGGGTSQPGLPHPRRADQPHPVAVGVIERRAQHFELGIPPDQRPDPENRKETPCGHGNIVTPVFEISPPSPCRHDWGIGTGPAPDPGARERAPTVVGHIGGRHRHRRSNAPRMPADLGPHDRPAVGTSSRAPAGHMTQTGQWDNMSAKPDVRGPTWSERGAPCSPMTKRCLETSPS